MFRPVFIVEDNAQDEYLIVRSLKKAGLANPLVLARDGEQASNLLFDEQGRAREPLPILIMLDLKLPRLTGLEVLQRIRHHPQTKLIPVVIFTSSDQQVDKLRCYEEGANSFVQKPIQFADFAEKVARIGLYWVATNSVPSE